MTRISNKIILDLESRERRGGMVLHMLGLLYICKNIMHPSKHFLISSVQKPLPASIVKKIISEVKRGPQMA